MVTVSWKPFHEQSTFSRNNASQLILNLSARLHRLIPHIQQSFSMPIVAYLLQTIASKDPRKTTPEMPQVWSRLYARAPCRRPCAVPPPSAWNHKVRRWETGDLVCLLCCRWKCAKERESVGELTQAVPGLRLTLRNEDDTLYVRVFNLLVLQLFILLFAVYCGLESFCLPQMLRVWECGIM